MLLKNFSLTLKSSKGALSEVYDLLIWEELDGKEKKAYKLNKVMIVERNEGMESGKFFVFVLKGNKTVPLYLMTYQWSPDISTFLYALHTFWPLESLLLEFQDLHGRLALWIRGCNEGKGGKIAFFHLAAQLH